MARSQRELAAALRVSKTSVLKWTRRTDWPFGTPPWPVAKVDAWRQGFQREATAQGRRTTGEEEEKPDARRRDDPTGATHAAQDRHDPPEPADPMADLFRAREHRLLDERIKTERARKIKLEADRLAAQQSELIPRRTLVEAMNRLTEVFVGALNELEEGLPLSLQGLDAPGIERVLGEKFDDARRRLLALADTDGADGSRRERTAGRPAAWES